MRHMETKIRKLRKSEEYQEENRKTLQEAGDILKRGGLVAFPTETVYGLGADALNEEAAKKIYAAKGRPSDNPLIVHITNMAALGKIVSQIPDAARKVAEAYWPGPLTMIFEKTKIVPYGTTGGLETVAVRMPSHPAARAVIDAGRELWRYYHAQPGALADAALYDIKMHFQGTKVTKSGKVQMAAESTDATYTALMADLRTKLKALALRIEPQVYRHGFLKE